MGNRLATLILVFGKAERGGATIFPRLGAAVRANVGDGYLWFNQKGDGSQVSGLSSADFKIIGITGGSG